MAKSIQLNRRLPFLFTHLGALSVFFVEFSWFALSLAVVFYIVRMFGLTGGFHRYFSHRSYKTSRFFQFFLGFLGTSAAQLGPLWWASHHRWHHRHSDTGADTHSPVKDGFFWAHIGWILCPENFKTKFHLVKDLQKYPELMFLEKHYYLPPILVAAFCFSLGFVCRVWFPTMNVNEWSALSWGFFASTVALYHGTFLVNSAVHLWGSRRYATSDNSRNNWWVALLTLGEGWHNNHHQQPNRERHGEKWWELDVAHLTIKAFEKCGLVWEIREGLDHPERQRPATKLAA